MPSGLWLKTVNMKKTLTYLFLFTEAVLYVIFVAGDIISLPDTKILKFVAIGILALFSLNCGKERENKTATAIFFFTLLADLFFVVLNMPLYGIGVYIIIQLLHGMRLSILSKKAIKKELLFRIILSLLAAAAGSLIGIRMILIGAYAVLIGVNIVHALMLLSKEKTKENIIYVLAMIILVIGDIGVGLRNMSLSFMTENMLNTAYIITWITYLPSLMLILFTTKALDPLKKRKVCIDKAEKN